MASSAIVIITALSESPGQVNAFHPAGAAAAPGGAQTRPGSTRRSRRRVAEAPALAGPGTRTAGRICARRVAGRRAGRIRDDRVACPFPPSEPTARMPGPPWRLHDRALAPSPTVERGADSRQRGYDQDF